jgi:dTDP-glucose 4,6-dehydratase
VRYIKNLLVTGGAGFIGSSFVQKAVNEGCSVVVLDALTYAGSKENLNDVDCHFIHGNINDRPLISSILKEFNIDAIIHMAAESHVDRSIENPNIFIETNVLGTNALLDCALNHFNDNPHFIFLHVSTDEVYGSLMEHGYFDNNSPINPSSPYSASKASSDLLVNSYHHTYNLPTIITRCTNNYGIRQYPEKLIPLVIHKIMNNQPIPIYGTGNNVRDWIHVDDHCDGIWMALTDGRFGEIYNFGGKSEWRNIDLVKTICSIMDVLHPGEMPHDHLITHVMDRLGHDFRYAVDITHAQNTLGFYPSRNVEKDLPTIVEWYIKQNNNDLINFSAAALNSNHQKDAR